MADRETNEARSKISMIVMKLLHQIGINKKIRRWRRYNFMQYEQLLSFIGSIQLENCSERFIFGSQIDGCTTPGLQSDLDIVYFKTGFIAIRNKQVAIPGKYNFLMVRDEDTHPGYFKLQCLDPFSVEMTDIFALDRNQRLVLKCSFFFPSNAPEIHGPATTTSHGDFTSDIIAAVRVTPRSQEDISWLLRPRQNTWIAQNEFIYFCAREVFLVPVGNPLSFERHLEWRVSFTAIERELMWRMNNTQIACCVLMKMINKCFITPAVGKGLSSYHCKTVLFHLIDNTHTELWKPNNLLTCLNLILKTLSLWVESGFCPNYFITDENMFLGKVHGPFRKRLHSVLVHLIDQDFKYLTQIGCDGLGQALSEVCSKEQTQPDTMHAILKQVQRRNGIDVKYSTVSVSTIYAILLFYTTLLQSDYTSVLHAQIQWYQSCSTDVQQWLSVLTALLCSHFGSQLASSCIATTRVCCRDIEMAHMFLWIGTYSDVTTGRLKLAGFYIKLGYASRALEVLNEVDKHFKHYVSDVSPVDFVFFKYETLHKIMTEEMKTDLTCRSCIALSVIYLPSEIHCTLPPLCYEMFRSVGADPDLRDPQKHYWYDWAVVDARPYMYFLQYQTYSALGMETQRKVALNNLSWAITQKRIRHMETCLNMLAYCLKQEGQLNLAWKYLMLSLKFKPEHNAAVWQILTCCPSYATIK